MALQPGVSLPGAAAIELEGLGARESHERSPVASVAHSASRAVEGSRIGEESRAAAPVGAVAGATRATGPGVVCARTGTARTWRRRSMPPRARPVRFEMDLTRRRWRANERAVGDKVAPSPRVSGEDVIRIKIITSIRTRC